MEPNNAGKLTSCFENHINVETVFSDSVFAFFFKIRIFAALLCQQFWQCAQF